jgi:hypothetical protein
MMRYHRWALLAAMTTILATATGATAHATTFVDGEDAVFTFAPHNGATISRATVFLDRVADLNADGDFSDINEVVGIAGIIAQPNCAGNAHISCGTVAANQAFTVIFRKTSTEYSHLYNYTLYVQLRDDVTPLGGEAISFRISPALNGTAQETRLNETTRVQHIDTRSILNQTHVDTRSILNNTIIAEHIITRNLINTSGVCDATCQGNISNLTLNGFTTDCHGTGTNLCVNGHQWLPVDSELMRMAVYVALLAGLILASIQGGFAWPVFAFTGSIMLSLYALLHTGMFQNPGLVGMAVTLPVIPLLLAAANMHRQPRRYVREAAA